MQAWEDVVMEDAAGAAVKDLAVGEALALEEHEALGHLGAGLGVYQPLPAGACYLDLLLRVQAPIALLPQQQHPYQPSLAPQRHRPHRPTVPGRVERYPGRLRGCELRRKL